MQPTSFLTVLESFNQGESKLKKQAKTQVQMFYEEQKNIGEANELFMELLNHPTNPLTEQDLIKLVARWPERYGRFAGFIGSEWFKNQRS